MDSQNSVAVLSQLNVSVDKLFLQGEAALLGIEVMCCHGNTASPSGNPAQLDLAEGPVPKAQSHYSDIFSVKS